MNLKAVGIMQYSGPAIVTQGSGDQRVIYKRNDDRFTDAMLMSNANDGSTTFLTLQLEHRPVGNGLFASLGYSTGSMQDINSGAWDNAYDQWRYNPAIHPNEQELNFSNFDRTHRLMAAFSYQREWWSGAPTTIGVIYTGVSGTPYSYVYDGDMNGDGESFNDLFFIPGQYSEIKLYDDEGNQLLYTDDAYNQLFKFIAEDEYLSTHRGRVAERNGARTPWIHQLDLRVAQGLTLTGSHRLEVSAEVLNMLNLLKASWGLVQTVPNHVVPILRPGFRWAPRTTPLVPEPLLSRWRLRLGVRYSF
jgi:hypothetical protein